MYKFAVLLLLASLSILEARRRATAQSQYNLGDFCMPGTCASSNSNCKRIGGNAFRCVCKEQYMAINKTHCVRVINASMDESCASCIQRNGICLDEDADDRMETCFCPTDNDLCNDRPITTSTVTPSYFMPITQPSKKNIASLTGRVGRQGEVNLALYDVNQQRLIANGDSVFIGDRLFIEIKYRTDDYHLDRHQIISENCSIASSVSDNVVKLEKIPLLIDRCPSTNSPLSIRFQRIDPDHMKSTIFQINQFQTTSVVYLRCSVAICYGHIGSCQERSCTDRSRNSSSIDYEEEQQRKLSRLITDLTRSFDPTNDLYEIRQVQQQFTIELPLPQPTPKNKVSHETLYGRTSLATQGAVERSTIIAAISIIFIVGISISLFIIYRTCYVEYIQRTYGSTPFAAFVNSPESIYGGLRSSSQAGRYDMGRRSEQRFDESFFVSNVEPLGAYRRQY